MPVFAAARRPAHSPDIPFDNRRIVDLDPLAEFGWSSEKRECIVDEGSRSVVGLEYASFMAALGADVTLIDQRPVILDFVDRQIVEALSYHLRQLGVTFRLGEKMTSVGIDQVHVAILVELESRKKIQRRYCPRLCCRPPS